MAIYIPAGSTFLCPLQVLLEPQTHTPNVLPDPPAQASKATSTVFSRDPVSPGPVCPIFSCAWTSNRPVVSSSRFVDPMASTTLRKKTNVLLVAWRARSGRSRPSRPPSSGLPGSSLPGPRRRSFRPASRFLSRASVFLLPRKLGHLGGASPHASLDSRAPSWAPLFCETWGSPSASELRNPSRGGPRPRPRGTARAAVLCVQRLRTCLRGGPERITFSSATASQGPRGLSPPGTIFLASSFVFLLCFLEFSRPQLCPLITCFPFPNKLDLHSKNFLSHLLSRLSLRRLPAAQETIPTCCSSRTKLPVVSL